MISFITNTIDNPWTDNDVRNYEQYGSQRDTVQYNSYYNWRLKLTDKNTFLCSLKTNANEYKNIYLFAVTRRLFYFTIFIPQLEVIKKWNEDEVVRKYLRSLPLTSKCLSSANKEVNLNDDVLFLDGSCVLIKVNAPVDGFLFPRNKSITNNVIKKQYALLNNLYFQFEREFDGLEKMIKKYNEKVGQYNAKIREHNEKIERKIEEQKEKIKRMLVRKGVRTGISIALAGMTGGLSLGLDALFDLGDVADIQDVLDMADMVDMAGEAMDAMDAFDVMDTFDAYDVLGPDVLDFSVGGMDDINIFDVGEGDDLLAESYNVSFGSNYSDSNLDRIYNPDIDRAYDKLGRDVDRISRGDVYSWEDPSNTIKRDNESIRYWERCKSEALSQSEIDQAKQDYWDSISDYCRERMSKKIHGA